MSHRPFPADIVKILECSTAAALDISPEVRQIPVSGLRAAFPLRSEGLNLDHVRTLAEGNEALPPIMVHYPSMRIIDGMHRVEAARMNDLKMIDARLVRGDLRDVFRLAVRSNVLHGLPLTLADRRAAAARLISADPQLSDRSIADTTGLAAKTVAGIRRGSSDGKIDRRIGRDGKVRPLSTADGRRVASRAILARPSASLREVAAEAGISVGTVRDVRARLLAGGEPVPDRRRPDSHREAPPAATAGGAPPAQQTSGAEVGSVIDRLRRDPSLRYTEAGRKLLQCLATHVTTLAELRDNIDSAPPHCASLVAKIARGCADVWSSLATELDQLGSDCA
jgi:ParB-like chromosome segregation protein Spo0J